MKNAILIHGRPDKEEYYDPNTPTQSNSYWFPWLSKQLQLKDIFAVALEIPSPWQPRYDIWKKEFERFDITPETMLVGHSCGGGFLVRWLSQNPDRKVGKVILVAPWINPDDNPESDTADFFHFQIEPNLVKRTSSLTIFNSDNDFKVVRKSVEILRNSIDGINYKEFHKYDHFCTTKLTTNGFPELLEELLK